MGIRADSPADIAAIRAAVSVPIIGIYKFDIPGFRIRITRPSNTRFKSPMPAQTRLRSMQPGVRAQTD